MLGKIEKIEIITNFKIEHIAPPTGDKDQARMGMAQMINAVFGGHQEMDGYQVVTDKTKYMVLIDNGQSCCESWGYLANEDDLSVFIGATLKSVELTDTVLNKTQVERSDNYYGDGGGIQFVDFVTDKGVFQLSVYNSHNGYYGHGILVAKDNEIVLNDTI